MISVFSNIETGVIQAYVGLNKRKHWISNRLASEHLIKLSFTITYFDSVISTLLERSFRKRFLNSSDETKIVTKYSYQKVKKYPKDKIYENK